MELERGVGSFLEISDIFLSEREKNKHFIPFPSNILKEREKKLVLFLPKKVRQGLGGGWDSRYFEYDLVFQVYTISPILKRKNSRQLSGTNLSTLYLKA